MAEPGSPTAPAEVKLEVTLGELVFYAGDDRPLSFGDAMVERAVMSLLHAEAVRGHVETFKRRVDAIRDEEIRHALRPIIADALSGPIRPTNTFGEARGEGKTLREMIAATAEAALKSTAKTAVPHRQRSVLEQIVEDEVRLALARDLQAEVKQAREEVLAAVRDQAAAVIAEAITRMARV